MATDGDSPDFVKFGMFGQVSLINLIIRHMAHRRYGRQYYNVGPVNMQIMARLVSKLAKLPDEVVQVIHEMLKNWANQRRKGQRPTSKMQKVITEEINQQSRLRTRTQSDTQTMTRLHVSTDVSTLPCSSARTKHASRAKHWWRSHTP